jgi:cytosine/adenosine deaminase-related metal-dependent hydrolase
VQPILTPRFAISCSDTLMAALQAMVGKDPSLHIQTHLAENPAEIEFTKQLFPFADTYTHGERRHFTNFVVLARTVNASVRPLRFAHFEDCTGALRTPRKR